LVAIRQHSSIKMAPFLSLSTPSTALSHKPIHQSSTTKQSQPSNTLSRLSQFSLLSRLSKLLLSPRIRSSRMCNGLHIARPIRPTPSAREWVQMQTQPPRQLAVLPGAGLCSDCWDWQD
jgi:hypothetical protein